MLVGDALYHNEAFMKSLASFGNILGLASLLIGQFAPFFIRPLFGYVASVVVRAYRRRALKFMVPAARERIDAVKRQKKDPEFVYESPMDIMQWIISACPDGSAEEIAALVLSLVGILSPFISDPTLLTFLFFFFLFCLITIFSSLLQWYFVQAPISDDLSAVSFSLSLSIFSSFLNKDETER